MWLTLTLTAFAAFLGLLFAFVWRGISREGALRARGAWYLVAAAGCFCVWAFALRQVPPPYPIANLKNYVPPDSVDPGPPAHLSLTPIPD